MKGGVPPAWQLAKDPVSQMKRLENTSIHQTFINNEKVCASYSIENIFTVAKIHSCK